MLSFKQLIRLVGLNLQALFDLRHYPRFQKELGNFRKLGGRVTALYPVLGDYRDSAGSMSGHYFHQDLLVAQKIFDHNPKSHLDIGSRIDGFVAHVAAFRAITVLDIRPVESSSKNIQFAQADLMNPDSVSGLTSDSVSCLHVLEHFGLGRYGDQIDPSGHLKGFANLARLLSPGGRFYLSFPIGRERVEFNAHRVIDPRSPLLWDSGNVQLSLIDFAFVDDEGLLHERTNVDEAVERNMNYGCGIYTFERVG